LECGNNGLWKLPGSETVASLLHCCAFTANFCPGLNPTYLFDSHANMESCDNTSPITSTISPFRYLRARSRFKCPVGHLRVSGHLEVQCGVNASQKGSWVSLGGLPMEPLVCESDEKFCPGSEGFHSHALSSASRKIGSQVKWACDKDATRISGSFLIICVATSGIGRWVDIQGIAASALRCATQAPVDNTATLLSLLPADVRSFRSVLSLGCDKAFTKIHGDQRVKCVLGTSEQESHGTGGRWVNSASATVALMPVCELTHDFCPPLDLQGLESSVTTLTDGYRLGSVASFRCHVGFQPFQGDSEVTCIIDPNSTQGAWAGTPRSCALQPHFCPELHPVNATVVETSRKYTLNEIVTMVCFPGFVYLAGDVVVKCSEDTTKGKGKWTRRDGTTALFLSCSGRQHYCDVPSVTNGYVAILGDVWRLDSLMELRCHVGHHDHILQVARQVSHCRHDENKTGGFFVPDNVSTTRFLECALVNDWCSSVLPPPNSHVSSANETYLAQQIGGTVELDCDRGYVRQSGFQNAFCGSNPSWRYGQWRSLDRGAVSVLSCVPSRLRAQESFCPRLDLADGSYIASLDQEMQAGTHVSFECKRGYRWVSGDKTAKCHLSAQGESGEWLTLSVHGFWRATKPLRCELEPNYCPGVGSPTTRQSFAPAALGALVEWSCQPAYQRVLGDTRMVCGHGSLAVGGAWRREHVRYPEAVHETIESLRRSPLVADDLAEPLVCQLNPIHGVGCRYFKSHWESRTAEFPEIPETMDVLPNIDLTSSDYDIVHFETYIKPPQSEMFTFHVEVVGRFVLSVHKRVLLEGESGLREEFMSQAVLLTAADFHLLSLQYVLDPEFPEDGYDGTSAHIRLFWESAGVPRAVVPATALYHSLKSVHGFPRPLWPVDHPDPCSGSTEFSGLEIGSTGYFTHGGPGYGYNPNMHCRWWIRTSGELLKFRFVVTTFDVEPSMNCVKDHLDVRLGNLVTSNLYGGFCGSYHEGHELITGTAKEMVVEFISDEQYERPGFNITFEILRPPTG